MKTWGHLFDSIVDHDNIALAVWKAQRGKSGKREVLDFCNDVETGINDVRSMLMAGCTDKCDYRYFKIFDTKERLICAAPFRLRVLHHALMNICGPLLDSKQIGNSFACQKGKGQYAALAQASKYHARFKWCLKLDVKKYFDSISHDILKEKLGKTFRDRCLLEILYAIVDSYQTIDGCGLPIGNLTSQYFANHYLCNADHYAQERLRVKGYVRYMDDILIWGNDRNILFEQGRAFRQLLQLTLGLQLKTFSLRRTEQTTEFLGYRLVKDAMLLSQRSMRRYRKKMKEYAKCYEEERWSEHSLLMHLEPLTAFVSKSDDMAFRRKVI